MHGCSAAAMCCSSKIRLTALQEKSLTFTSFHNRVQEPLRLHCRSFSAAPSIQQVVSNRGSALRLSGAIPDSRKSCSDERQKLFSRIPRILKTRSRELGRTFASASQDQNSSWTGEITGVAKSSLRRTDLQVVLVSPQIPGNTGCIARTCAAAAVGLHLVEPLGFEINSAKLKRAGLDYWPFVVVKVHSSWADFFQYFQEQEGEKRLLGFTKKGALPHTVVKYRPGDWLLFGSETEGIPDAALQECMNDKHGGGTVRIPIDETYVRCLNLSVAAGIGVYEALRQEGHIHVWLPKVQADLDLLADRNNAQYLNQLNVHYVNHICQAIEKRVVVVGIQPSKAFAFLMDIHRNAVAEVLHIDAKEIGNQPMPG